MCEKFQVKCKPAIKPDMVLFVWQPANVMYGGGHGAMSLLHEKGGKSVREEKEQS